MTPDSIYDVLVQECSASEGLRDNFVASLTSYRGDSHPQPLFDYRFRGSLGFGGKYYETSAGLRFVNCNAEDETPERRAIIDAANQRLKA